MHLNSGKDILPFFLVCRYNRGMETLGNRLTNALSGVFSGYGLRADELAVVYPEEQFGDLSTNGAMIAAKKAGRNPREVAQEAVEKLKQDKEIRETVVDIKVEGPGFINLWIKTEKLLEEAVKAVRKGENYGEGSWGEGRRVLVDYSAPNIAKQFSVGHLRSTIVGQALINLYKFGGFEAIGDNHLGDWGTQFGMIIAAVEEKGLKAETLSIDELEGLYVDYSRRVKLDEGLLELAREAFLRLENEEEKAVAIWKATVETSKKEFQRIYDLLGVKIDYEYGESFYSPLMPKVIEEAVEKGVARESEGALIMELNGLPPAMLKKSNGTTTYFTRDLATVKFRQENEDLKADLYIYEVGAEQTLHFQQVFKAAEVMGYAKEKQMVHVGHGLVMGADGKKMSTRKGTNAKLEDLLKEMIEAAAKFNPKTAKEVGIGAMKFNDLKRNPRSNYKFDMEEALRLDGDSGPYLQYTYSRACSVLGKAGEETGKAGVTEFNAEELGVLKMIYRFAGWAETAARVLAPNLLCEYLLETAKRYNSLYNAHRILQEEDEQRKANRLVITRAVTTILGNGLRLLGIEPIERM